MKNKSVILFFARTSAAEILHKNLCKKGNKINTQLHSFLYKKTLSEITKTGLPVIICHEAKQIGNNFGTRYANAIKDCFNNGYDSVIAIGADCPQLKATDILYSHQQLAKGNNVLGPDNRGGIYLMGIQKTQFFAIDFTNIKWHSSAVLSQLQSCFASIPTTTCLLENFTDVNGEKDILYLIKKYNKSIFVQALQEIIFGFQTIFSFCFSCYKSFFLLHHSAFTGPPALLFI